MNLLCFVFEPRKETLCIMEGFVCAMCVHTCVLCVSERESEGCVCDCVGVCVCVSESMCVCAHVCACVCTWRGVAWHAYEVRSSKSGINTWV